MKRSLIACIISATLLAGCGPTELTPEEKQQVNTLKSELSQTEGDITLAREQDNQYSGGLIKSLIKAKLEVLETNKALIQQRINAIESGAKINITVSGLKPDPTVAESLKNEIDELKKDISTAKIDATQYSGGLVLAMKQTAIATQEQTLTMLQQKYLTAKYGLAEVKTSQDATSTVTTKSNETTVHPKEDNQSKPQPLLPAGDGPFGLDAALTKKNIEDMTGQTLVASETSTNLYFAKNLPKENSNFESYGLVISPKVGLCQIRAIGKTINTDSYGIELKSAFEDLKSSLDSIYGKGEKEDFLLPGSIWKEPQDWMMGLYKKERIYMAEWKSGKDAMKKNSLTYIGMGIRSVNSSSGFVLLEYHFNNDSSCQEEMKNAKKSSL